MGVLAALAWAAATLLNGTTRAWNEKDVSLRARAVVAGAREALVTHVSAGDRRRAAAVLAEIARDDRIMAAAVCGRGMRTLARTGVGPRAYECEALGERLADASADGKLELDRVEDAEGGLVHLTAQPLLGEDGALLGHVVLVHDLSFVARREAAMRRYTAGAFAVVALLASILTVLVRRLSWRSWNEELRRLISLGRAMPGSGGRTPRKEFQPLLSDVRQLVSDLAAESSHGARWAVVRRAAPPHAHRDAPGRGDRHRREPRALHPRPRRRTAACACCTPRAGS